MQMLINGNRMGIVELKWLQMVAAILMGALVTVLFPPSRSTSHRHPLLPKNGGNPRSCSVLACNGATKGFEWLAPGAKE